MVAAAGELAGAVEAALAAHAAGGLGAATCHPRHAGPLGSLHRLDTALQEAYLNAELVW